MKRGALEASASKESTVSDKEAGESASDVFESKIQTFGCVSQTAPRGCELIQTCHTDGFEPVPISFESVPIWEVASHGYPGYQVLRDFDDLYKKQAVLCAKRQCNGRGVCVPTDFNQLSLTNDANTYFGMFDLKQSCICD